MPDEGALSETGQEARPYAEYGIDIEEEVGRAAQDEELWIDKRRPGYNEETELLAFLDRSYEGGRAFLDGGYLSPFTTEILDEEDVPELEEGETRLSGDFRRRAKQASRINVVAELIDSMTAFLSGREPQRKLPSGRWVKKWAEGVDRSATQSITRFSREGGRRLLLHGAWLPVTDVTPTPRMLNRMAELEIEPRVDADGFMVINDELREKLGRDGYPYSWHLHPSNYLNGRLDDEGLFEEILYREKQDAGKTLMSGEAGTKMVYYLVHKDRWQTFEIRRIEGKKRQLIRTGYGPNLLGKVNVGLHRLRPRTGDWGRLGVGVTYVEDWAWVDRQIYDLLSAFGWNLTQNSATQIYISGNLSQILDPDVRKTEIAEARKASRSPAIVLGMQAEVGSVNKSFEQANLMFEAVERLIRIIFQLTGFRDKFQEGAAPESGEARLRAFQLLNALLAQVGHVLSQAERQMIGAVAGFVGEADDAERIGEEASTYPANYDVRAAEDALLLIEKLWGRAPDALMKAILIDLAEKLFADKGETWLAKLRKEIEDWEMPGSFGSALGELQAAAGAGKQLPGQTPPDKDGDDDDDKGGPADRPPARPVGVPKKGGAS
jgi:hypothetical protein